MAKNPVKLIQCVVLYSITEQANTEPAHIPPLPILPVGNAQLPNKSVLHQCYVRFKCPLASSHIVNSAQKQYIRL